MLTVKNPPVYITKFRLDCQRFIKAFYGFVL